MRTLAHVSKSINHVLWKIHCKYKL